MQPDMKAEHRYFVAQTDSFHLLFHRERFFPIQ